MSNLLDLVKQRQMRDDIPDMRPGDTVRVHARIIEGNKERVQVYEGVIIGIRRAQNASTVTVRRISHNSIGVERTFLIHSPRIDRYEVVRRGRVRRAKLYYLRERQGKSARIKERKPAPRVTGIAKEGIPGSVPTPATAVAAATIAEPNLETAATPNYTESVMATEDLTPAPAGAVSQE